MEKKPLILHIAPQKNDVYCPYDVPDKCSEKTPFELLQDEIHSFMSADLIIINLNYTLSGNFDGIELLKLIRLHHINTHCIVYSPDPELSHIKADANKSILLSEGVTFFEIPAYIDEAHLDFEKLISQKSPENLEDYFLHDYKQFFSDNRHFNANWWGPLRILEYLKRADNIANEEDIFQGNSEVLAMKSSYNGLVLRYVKTLKEQSVWDSKIMDMIAEKEQLEHKNELLEGKITPVAEAIGQAVGGVMDPKLIEQVIASATSPIHTVIGENQEIIETREQTVAAYQQDLKSQHTQNASTQSIEILRSSLAKREPEILYIDDMAGYGWNVVLQRLIYKKNQSDAFEIQSFFQKDTENYAELAKTIVRRVKEVDTKLIILDLRLKNEKGDVKAKDLSGIQLLEALREQHVACPILIITASKDPETIDQVYASGADACWRKEGIDENNATNPEERVAYTWKKIEQLLKMINTLCGPEFKFLYKTMLADYYYTISAQDKGFYWWEVIGSCNETGMESVSREEFLKQWENTILTYQQALVTRLKGRPVQKEFLAPCQAMFGILESIHPVRKTTDENGNVIKIKGFSEKLKMDFSVLKKHNNALNGFVSSAFDAIEIRNSIIHPKTPVTSPIFQKCVEYLMKGYFMTPYKDLEPFFPSGKTKTDGNNIPQLLQHKKKKKKKNKNKKQGQPVVFAFNPIINYTLDEVSICSGEVSQTSKYDYARIKALQKNADGSLRCQLSDTHFSIRVIDKLVHEGKEIDPNKDILFTPTRFDEDNRIDVDLFYDNTTAWQGKIFNFTEFHFGDFQKSKKVCELQCLNPNRWFTIANNESFDRDSLQVGDSIQFHLRGDCIVSGELGGN